MVGYIWPEMTTGGQIVMSGCSARSWVLVIETRGSSVTQRKMQSQELTLSHADGSSSDPPSLHHP